MESPTIEEWPTAYEDIFDAQGIPSELRNTSEYFLYTVTPDDLDKNEVNSHIGETYALPRAMCIPGHFGEFALQVNGAVISTGALVEKDVTVGNRAIIGYAAELTDNTHIGPETTVNRRAQITLSDISAAVDIGANSIIDGSTIGDSVVIGKSASIHNAVIDSEVIVGDGVVMEGQNKVGYKSILKDMAGLGVYAKLGPFVKMGEGSHVGDSAVVGTNSEIMAKQSVAARSKIRPGTLIYPQVYKRARKSDQ